MPYGEFVDSAVPPELRERVLSAALDELTRWGVERFSVEAMATGHGIDADSVYRYWGNTQRLLLDVMFHKSDQTVVTPNTGSLRGDLFRFGASSLLGDIERQLEHHLTGRYSAANRHPMG